MSITENHNKTAIIEDIRSGIQEVIDLPTLPTVALEIRKLVNDPSSNISDLERLIEADVALTSRILRIANSAYYGIPRKVDNLKMAMVILGVLEIVNLVTSVSVLKMFKNQSSSTNFSVTEFFIHSTNCAELTVGLFKGLKINVPSGAYISGLLHDIGKLMLNQYFPDYLEASMTYAEEHDIQYADAELEVLGIDHGHIGGWVAKRWNIPEEIIEAITQHHVRPDTKAKHCLPEMIEKADKLCYLIKQFNKEQLITYLGKSKEWQDWLGDRVTSLEKVVDILFKSLERSSLIIKMLES